MPANATFTVTFNVTPSTAGTLANPRVGSVCRIDSSSVVTETDETNNNCADSVTVVNSAPVAVNDSATTAEDTTVAIDAAANDTDVDGTSPTVKPGWIEPGPRQATLRSAPTPARSCTRRPSTTTAPTASPTSRPTAASTPRRRRSRSP